MVIYTNGDLEYDFLMAERFVEIAASLPEGLLTKEQISDRIFSFHPDYSPASCLWVIGKMIERGWIGNLGYGYYRKSPVFQELSLTKKANRALLEEVTRKFPQARLEAFETGLIEVLGGFEADTEILFLSIDKKHLFELYLFLKEKGERDVMLQPTAREIEFYMRPNSIILRPLFSRAPSRKGQLASPEKLIVDLIKDKTIHNVFPYLEQEECVHKILSMNAVNFQTILQYASRRNCREEILGIIKEDMPLEIRAKAEGNADD